MNITDQASQPSMEEILSSLRVVASSHEMTSKPAPVAPVREKALAPKPEPKLQPKPEAQPSAGPQRGPDPEPVEDVAASAEADESGPHDHFDFAEAIEAIQQNGQFRRVIARTDRKIVARVVSAWKELRAARKQIGSDQSRVDAAKLALGGLRRESQAGTRTALDVLDAEKAYLDAQVALIGARREEVVASNELLASVGRLTAEFLRLPVGTYDPAIHRNAIRGREIAAGSDTGKPD